MKRSFLPTSATFTGAFALALSFAACDNHGHDHDHGHGQHGEKIEDEACLHMAEGPAEAVTATAEADGAPNVSKGHTRFDVTLAAVDGGNGGVVSYTATKAKDHVIFVSKDVALVVRDAAGAEVEIEKSSDVGECDEVVKGHTVDLGVGTYTLHLGPTNETAVSLVIEAVEHHD